MSSGPYKTHALAGAGTMGSAVVKAFSAQGIPLVLLTRVNGSKLAPELASLPHVTVKQVDYASHASLVSALKSIDAVVSTLSTHNGEDPQFALFDAAKEAGVKVVVPSEFGLPTPGWTEKNSLILPGKIKVQEHLKKIGLPYALFISGNFAEWVPLFVGFTQSGGKSAFAVGSGNGAGTINSISDTARFVVHAVTKLPAEQVEWKEFRIEADRKSPKEIVALISKKVGREIPITYKDLEPTRQAALEAGFPKFVDWLASVIEEGKADVHYDERTGRTDAKDANHLFPDWNPKSVEEVIAGLDLK